MTSCAALSTEGVVNPPLALEAAPSFQSAAAHQGAALQHPSAELTTEASSNLDAQVNKLKIVECTQHSRQQRTAQCTLHAYCTRACTWSPICLFLDPIKSLRTSLPGELRLAPHAPSPGWKAFLLLLLLTLYVHAARRVASSSVANRECHAEDCSV